MLGLSDGTSPSAAADDPSSETPTPAPTSDAPPVFEYKRVKDSTGAISLDVPAGWATAPTRFEGIDGIDSPGTGFRIGPDPTAVRFVSEETDLGGRVQTQAFDDLNLDDYDEFGVRAELSRRREAAYYLVEAGCVPTPTGQPDLGERWYGAARVWQDCALHRLGGAPSRSRWSRAARDAYVFVQIGLAPDDPGRGRPAHHRLADGPARPSCPVS